MRVREGCTLTRQDGTVWADSGEVFEIALDSPDPSTRSAAQLSLRGQHGKVCPAPPATVERSDRSMEAPVTRKKARRKAPKKD